MERVGNEFEISSKMLPNAILIEFFKGWNGNDDNGKILERVENETRNLIENQFIMRS